MKYTYVLDWSAFLYRAWHAYPPMSDRDGNQINMIYGFYRMLMKLLMEKPYNLIVVRDAKWKTVRHDQYESYKANRPDMPEDFGRQIRLCKLLAEQLCIPTFEIVGYEADDIIYTMAKSQHADSDHIVVYTWDKDIKQILDCQNVTIHDPIKDEVRTLQRFEEEFGFHPSSMVDYLSLIGDTSDNVPWARGIGPKGASDLIRQYQTIERIYDNLTLLSEKTRQLLIESKENVLQAKKLISLYHVPGLSLDTLTGYRPDIVLWKEVLVGQYQFQSFEKLLDELKKVRYYTPQGLF